MGELNQQPEPVDQAIGQRVRERREALRITQSELAVQIGVTFQQVQKYERATNRISASRLLRIAAVLKTSVSALVGEGEGDLAATPEAIDLLRAFAVIDRPEQRRALVEMARSLIPQTQAQPAISKAA